MTIETLRWIWIFTSPIAILLILLAIGKVLKMIWKGETE